ncbi:uncharacterized protein LOC128986614 isoform X3 [Macrosteles quadrilineatus]|uniref:uncharacterized protein LOC128986614 isoform X3 n=1 Tax=Macrosteles quadrilineatus TaxID=74068 RepID=UPI0023E2153D|nr:uncharacterized protein LOC128986614 isoform X3 [Macrosteles quadrilineatus]
MSDEEIEEVDRFTYLGSVLTRAGGADEDMTTRTKEEELALDEKIARIQRQNEKILRRQKEIEEDKRMAEQQNATVKLKQPTGNVSRERTPALKPSNRELRPDVTEDDRESWSNQRAPRGSSRGRGSERVRGQGDWKGGFEHRGERGRRGGGRMNEDEWRAERMKIDEARIQRQRAADGKWRREWDNDKLQQEPLEEPRHEVRKFDPPHQEKWSPPNQHRGQFHTSPERPGRHPSRGGTTRVGRGRGRCNPLELEIPLDVIPSKISPAGLTLANNAPKSPAAAIARPPSPHNICNSRLVECVGNNVKISIPNRGAAQSSPKPQRQPHETRGRYKSQTSYSSQSDDDTPRERSNRGRRQRSHKSTKEPDKIQPNLTSAKASLDQLPVQNKPPLPPFRAEHKPQEVKDPVEAKDGDESWEDVTTSGTESMGEEMSSVTSSPLMKTIVNTMVISGKQNEVTDFIQSVEYSPNQVLDVYGKMSYEEFSSCLENNKAHQGLGFGVVEVDYPDTDTSSVNLSLDASGNILLAGICSEELLIGQEEQQFNTTLPETLTFDELGLVGVIDELPQNEPVLLDENPLELVNEQDENPLKLLVDTDENILILVNEEDGNTLNLVPKEETILVADESLELSSNLLLQNEVEKEKVVAETKVEYQENQPSEENKIENNTSKVLVDTVEAIQTKSDLTNSETMPSESNKTHET